MRAAICLVTTLSLIGCADDGEAGPADSGSSDGSGTSASTTGSVTITTSTTGSSTTTTGTTTEPTGSEGGVDSTDAGSTGADGSESGAGSESSSGGDQGGTCQQGCREPVDCCPMGAQGCPGDEYPNNYTCEGGLCVFGGCGEDNDCPNIPLGQECHDIDGVGTCFVPCDSDLECAANPGTACDGMADDGAMFCALAPAPCEVNEDCEGAGLCDETTGECFCTMDRDCTSDTADTCVPG